MKFTQLRLAGFKSFVDPTELRIDPGLTGIIGPNGCGKSNLLEALRWVMGATSAKSLRGEGMEDVIFAGTDVRPPRNHAEVILTVDNADKLAPARFNAATTLEVTRRITRGAGSAYKINGEEVRAKDVQLLFADAGTGANSPALVRQGQISELIAAKPQNRRRVLEEAAGVSGLRARRHEAELRLKGAETNLERLQDVIDDADNRHASLQKQARQAGRYRKLSASIRTLEAAVWLNRWREAASQVERAEAELAERLAAAEEATRIASEARLKAEIEAAAREPARKAEAEAAAALRLLERERDKLEADARDIDNRIKAAETRLVELGAADERERQIIGDAQTSRNEIATQIETLDKATSQQEEALAFAEAAARDAEARRKERDAVLDAKSRDAVQRRADLDAARKDADRLSARLDQIEREIGMATAQREAALTSTALADLAEAEDQAETAETELQTARAALENAETLRTESARLRDVAAEAARQLIADRDGLDREIQVLERTLASASLETRNPALDAVKARSGFEQALAAALGDDLEASLDTDAARHWRETDCRVDMLPGGSVPLSDHVKGPAALTARLSAVGIVKADRAEQAAKALKPGQRIVTLEGDLWRWDGFIARADAPSAAVARLEQKNRLEAIQAERLTLDEPLAQRAAELEEAETILAQAKHAEAQARQALPELERHARETLARIGALREKAASDKTRAETLAERLSQLADEQSSSATALSDAQSRLRQLDGLGDDHAAVEKARAQAETARLAEADARAALESVRREAQMRADQRSGLTRDLDAWSQRCAAAETRIEEIARQQTEVAEALDTLKLRPDEIEQTLHALTDRLDAADRRAREAREAATASEDQMTSADSTARQAESAASAAREGRAAAEARLSGEKERLRDTVERLQDATGAAPGTLAHRLADEDLEGLSPDELERRLNEARQSRERLGAVNLRADEEAEELAKSVAAMTTERDDLLAAISKLRKGIEELSTEGRTRLLEAFEIVDGHFRELFETLFEGGHAELRLTEADDPLEAGLEIFACPPGKKLERMSLMSGGEQALTASALIFAVFLSNPAPVCVLDEVDAPLDDANVDRYCRMLDRMRALTRTRFLVITHNPLTMSRVDRLFGVTMAERGVSQLVSVDLAGAEQLIAAE